MRSYRVLIPIVLGIILSAGLIGGFAYARGLKTVNKNPDILHFHVDADAPGPVHDGTSWTNAFTNVQDALALVGSSAIIWVAEGVYYPDEGMGQENDDITSTFELFENVSLYGGFDPGSGAVTLPDRDWDTYVTVLSGDIDHETSPDTADANGVVTKTVNISGNNAYHVVSSSGVSDAARLDGFVITAGDASGSFANPCGPLCGGGMINTSSSSPSLFHLTFSGNRAGIGGGMWNYDGSSPSLSDVTFTGNSADSGGGMYNYLNCGPILVDVQFIRNISSGDGGGMVNQDASNTSLTDTTFSENTASGEGGGMKNTDSDPELMNVIFTGNTADSGGGVYNTSNSYPRLTNVLFSGNSVSVEGGGLFNDDSSNPELINVTIAGNTADSGGGMSSAWFSNPELTNTILYSNVATVTMSSQVYNTDGSMPVFSYSLVQDSGGSISWDTSLGTDNGNNIDSDPLFIRYPDSGDGDWNTPADNDYGDLHLIPGSPAIDAGTNSGCPSMDLDGVTRPAYLTCDMGAYEAVFPELGIIKSVQPLQAYPSAQISYTLIISNSGLADAEDVVISDTIPATVTNTTVVSSGIVITPRLGTRYIWDVGDLVPGQSGVISITGVLSEGNYRDVFTNTTEIGTSSLGDDLGNNKSAAVLLVKAGFLLVDEESPGPIHDGLTWTTAYTTVQDALAIATNGVQIWVAEGVYYPDEGFGQVSDYLSSTYKMVEGVAVFGGFDPGSGVDTFPERDWEIYPTVLSGDIDHETNPDLKDPTGVVTTSENISGSNAYHVASSSYLSNLTELNGFYITAGDAHGDPGFSTCKDLCGGGMVNYTSTIKLTDLVFLGNAASAAAGMYNYNSSPELLNVAFFNNAADLECGGMINNDGSSPTLTDVVFSGNSGYLGGGMFNNYNSNPVLYNVDFINNSVVTLDGGGMYISNNSNPSLNDVVFYNNTAARYGGGLYNYHSSPEINNVAFYSNTAEVSGGGMFNDSSDPLQLTNVTFFGNSATEMGGGIYNLGPATLINAVFAGNSAVFGGGFYNAGNLTLINVTFANNNAILGGGMYGNYLADITNAIFWGNTATLGSQIYKSFSYPVFRYSLIEGSGGSASWDTNLGTDGGDNIDLAPLFLSNFDDLHMQPGSPAIDSGTNSGCPAFDLDGLLRPVGLACDMGANEFRGYLIFMPLLLK